MKEVVLDCIGDDCHLSVKKTESALQELEIGDNLIVQITDFCAGVQVPSLARRSGHNVEIIQVEDGEWEVIIEKTKQ